MATLPATTNLSGGAPQPQPSNNLATGFAGLSIFRQVGILVGFAASIAIGLAVGLWSMEPDYRPILADVNNVNASQAVDLLQASQIPFKIDQNSGALMVAAADMHQARLKLAAAGIADQPNVGFELLDKDQGLGTSQFMENVSFRRGLEGELARTISSLHSVKAARVHLAMPRTSVFVRDQRKPSASVFVDLMPARGLNNEQVQAIINLVASSVPEMDPADVTIVDQRGRLMSEQHQDEASVMAAQQFDYTRKLEDKLTRRVQQILEPVIGPDKFKTQVSANVDFTAIEQTAESYNPDLPALRSEQTLDEQRAAGAGAGGVPGALSNQPPGAATAPEVADAAAGADGAPAAAGNSRTQATRNYELDRTISYTKHQLGRVQRLSVAVVVDHLPGAADGDTTGEPWTQEDLEQMTELVKGAIGYDAARGDTVTVINAPFATIEIEEIVPEETSIMDQPWFQQMSRMVGGGIILLVIIFAVLRPLMKSLANSGEREQQLVMAAAAAQAAAEAGTVDGAAGAAGGSAVMNPATGETRQAETPFMLPGPGASYDEQLAAVRTMVADDPARVAQVMKQWVNAGNEE